MSRPKDRVSAAGLLPNMEARLWADKKTVTYRGKINGRWENLGTDRQAALQAMLDRCGRSEEHGTLRWLWRQWQDSAQYTRLSAGTQADYGTAWKQIDKTFGHMQAGRITAPMVARYVHVERAKHPSRGRIEKAVLSNLFGHGIMLGVCLTNPTIGVKPPREEPSDVMPEDAALRAFATWLDGQTPQRRVLAVAMRFAACEGSRQCEFLSLSRPQVDQADGLPLLGGRVRMKRAKQRGKKRGEVIEAVEITPALHAVLLEAWALNRDCLYLFPTEDNNAYTAKGFKTLWQRCVAAAIKAKVIRPDQRFNFHALRRYFNTMHKAKYGELADLHANPSTTARVYDATKVVNRRAL